MHIVVYLPLLISALLAVFGPPVADRMPPRAATRLLLAAGLACAAGSLAGLTLLAWTLVGRLPLVAAVGGWSGEILDHLDPVPAMVAKLAGLALIALTGRTLWSALRSRRDLRLARRASDGFAPGRLVVLDRSEPEAFAIPGGRREGGRIVVSAGLLRSLDATERRALLAHEAAHLRHRHHRHRMLAALIAAADPLLVTLPGAIQHLTERWADEDAAETVKDRTATAHALARVALAAQGARRRSVAVLCFGHGSVPRRVSALLTGAPPRRPLATVVLGAALLGSLLSAAKAGSDTAGLFDRADDAYHARPLSVATAVDREARHLLAVITGRDHDPED